MFDAHNKFRHPNKPLYASETCWQGGIYGHPKKSADDLRKTVYAIAMSAATLNFADLNGNSSSGFSGSMDFKDINGAVNYDGHAIVKKVWDFFESIPFYRMSPDKSKTSKGFALVEEGEQYLVYLENGGNVNVNVKSGETYKVT